MIRRIALALLLVAAVPAARSVERRDDFAALVERLSEPDGQFHSDNLVSNETGLLHVFGVFRDYRSRGGAYLGVGPEQNFSYLAELEPEIAFIIDIRRDNLLLHLLFKAMFATAGNRLEFLCLLYGRPTPPDLAQWTDLPLASLLDYLDGHPVDSAGHARNHDRLMDLVTSYGVPVSESDRATLRRFHDEFAGAGLDLRYTTRVGRMGRWMPTARELYRLTDLEGNEAGYLATEDRWRRVRDLERRNRVIPVVGDLAGPKAIRAIGAYLAQTRRTVSVFYLSNIEQYLFRNGVFPAFAANLRALPATPKSLLVRSVVGYFGPGGWPDQAMNAGPRGLIRQRAQTFDRFRELTVAADSVDYRTLVADAVEPRR